MMDVLVLSDLWAPFPGGAERMIFNLSRYLAQTEDVQVVTGYHPAQQFDGPPVHVLSAPDDDDGWALIRGEVERADPDVILTHHWWAQNWRSHFEELAERIPVVQLVYNGKRIHQAALAVYISEFVRERCGDSMPSDMTILPPAFNDVVASQHGSAVGFIKPLPHKGVGLVYEVARQMPHERFVILRGEWQDIEAIEQIGNVEFLDPVDDIREFYERVDLVLMPSRSEDAGSVAQECALNMIPCVSSDVEGLRETNRGGIRIDEHDARRWVNVIKALRKNPAHYDRVVHSQRLFWNTYDQDARLRQFHERLLELA
jgi:glycosyltransferase involved in cell wall biosynthesis